jgi:hypothetical protein
VQQTQWSFPGYIVRNVPADGQCAFSAIAHQLQLNNYVSPTAQISGHSVRQDIVSFIRNNAQLKSAIVQRLSGATIDEYLTYMAMATSWADENIFYAASKLYDLEIRILTCDGARPIIIGSPSVAGRSISVGYVSYVVGESPTHYVSLIPCAGLESSADEILIHVADMYLSSLYTNLIGDTKITQLL